MTPRQANLMITAGTITMKYTSVLLRFYEQMSEPKYLIAMCACTITGEMLSADLPSAVGGVDKLISVEVYLPRCPPKPEAIMDAIFELLKKISDQSLQERSHICQTHRCYGCTHNMKITSQRHTEHISKI